MQLRPATIAKLTDEEKKAAQIAEAEARLERARIVTLEATALLEKHFRERRLRKGLTYLLERTDSTTPTTTYP